MRTRILSVLIQNKIIPKNSTVLKKETSKNFVSERRERCSRNDEMINSKICIIDSKQMQFFRLLSEISDKGIRRSIENRRVI